MHVYFVEDAKGDLVDVVSFCSDSCHRQWCRDNDRTYNGWNGCHETTDRDCALCGMLLYYRLPEPECVPCADRVMHVHEPEDADPERYEHTCPGSE